MSALVETDDLVAEFEHFVAEVEPPLRRALVARYGPELGRDATAEALAFAWANWARVKTMSNPAGYLFRVGQSGTRRRREGLPRASGVTEADERDFELVAALGRLSWRQRVAVVLIHGDGHTSAEVAEILGCSPTTAQTHLERGLARLRKELDDG